jgi:hypothetical protein
MVLDLPNNDQLHYEPEPRHLFYVCASTEIGGLKRLTNDLATQTTSVEKLRLESGDQIAPKSTTLIVVFMGIKPNDIGWVAVIAEKLAEASVAFIVMWVGPVTAFVACFLTAMRCVLVVRRVLVRTTEHLDLKVPAFPVSAFLPKHPFEQLCLQAGRLLHEPPQPNRQITTKQKSNWQPHFLPVGRPQMSHQKRCLCKLLLAHLD